VQHGRRRVRLHRVYDSPIPRHILTRTRWNLPFLHASSTDTSSHSTSYQSGRQDPSIKLSLESPSPLTILQAFVLECKLALREPSERGCRAFEEGLANIRLAPGDQWFHTHTSSYDRVHPSTSTYTFRFQFGPIYVFRIVWNTDSYPPQNITKLPYPPNICFLWSTTIPLIIGDLWHKLPPEEVTFFRGVLKESTSKGKGRV
jgi:hypothetical protein